MSKAGPLLVVAGLACAGIGLALPWSEPRGERASSPADDLAQPRVSDGPSCARVTKLGIVRHWLSWSRPEVGESAAPVVSWPAPVVVMVRRRAEPPGPSTNPVPGVHDRASLVRALQHGLKRAGCYHGQITGEWTRESRKAMQALTIHLNAQLPVEVPDDVLLALVEGQPDNICSVACPSGEALAGDGRCLPAALLAKNVPAPPPSVVMVTERGVPQSTISSRASTTNGRANATATPAVALPEGRMALAGPKSPTVEALLAPPAPIQRKYVSRAAAGTRMGFSVSIFKQLDRVRH